MHPLVPEIIQAGYLSGQSGGEFPAAGLFLDVSGFSTITDALMAHGQHGAEVLAQAMRAVFDPLIEHIFAQGGFVAASAGDSLTALFPANGTGPECRLRALAAAWNIARHMAGSPTFPTVYGSFDITARVGLAEGLAHWGIIAEPGAQRGVYFFQGPAIDASALAQQRARAGEVVLSAELAARLGDDILSEPVSPEYARLLGVRAALPAPWPVPEPRINRQALSFFYPAQVVDLQISGEFRQVVSLMINLPSIRTETQLRIFMESVFALQETYGGLVNNLDFGDKGTNLLIFWGAPAALENDITRALNFILALQSSTSIPISAGITYRIAHAGFAGGRRYEAYTCYGRGINLAARLMAGAPRGEIWLDEPVARRAGHEFEMDEVGERSFKGFGRPQKVYALVGRKEPDEALFQGRLAGREADRAALSVFLQPLFQGRFAGLLVVSGEPGIGKSRLVHAFLAELEAGQPGAFQVFLAQADEILRQPFNPFVYWLRRYFGTSEEQGEARSKRSFNRKLDDLIALCGDPRLAEELDRTRSFLGALVGLRWADSLYEQLDAQARYNNTFIALAALLQAESLCEPVVLVLEDIHQLDDDSRTFLPYLVNALQVQDGPALPLALLCTSRHDLPGLGLEIPGAQDLPLHGLDRAGLDALAQASLGGPPAAGLLDLLEERAEGNPFYAEQILLYMKEENLLARANGNWDYVRRQIDQLPTDVNSLLVSRLDHLTQTVREIVQTAAVLGREFDVDLLSCILRNCQATGGLSEVSIAEQEGIWERLSEVRYLFRHILMREAAYQMQVHTRRQRLHALALEAYQTLHAADLSNHSGELAYHAEQAGLDEPACRYLRLAGEAARDAYQNGPAVDYFTRALALTPQADPAARCDLLLEREALYDIMGRQAERLRDLEELEALLPTLDQVDRQAEIYVRHVRSTVDHARYAEAERYGELALALAQPAGLLIQQSRVWFNLAAGSQRRGRLEQAETQARTALALAEQAGSLLEVRLSLNILGLIAVDQGRLEVARECFIRGLEIARQLGRLNYMIAPLNNLGMVGLSSSDFSAGLSYYRQALDIARQVGDRSGEGVALSNLGFISGILGEYATAISYLQDSLQINRAIGHAYYEAYTLFNLSAFTGALGDHETAEQLARQGWALSKQRDDRSGEAWGQTYLGHSLLARGRLAEAADAYRAALAIRQAMNQPALAAEPSAGLAQVALAQGNLPAAHAALEPVLAYLDAGGSLDAADEPLRVYLTCYQVLEQAADPRAPTLLDTAQRLLEERAARISSPDTRRAFLTNIAHHRAIQSAWQRLRGS